MAIRWTPAELEERARADAEIEAGPFRFTDAEIAFGRLFDREVILDRMDSKQKRIAESQRRYYEAHKEEIAEAQRRYREAHKEEIAEGKRELRDARIALGLTQREAAELLGVDQSTVCRWETIKPPPNWRTMIEKLTSQHKKRRRF